MVFGAITFGIAIFLWALSDNFSELISPPKADLAFGFVATLGAILCWPFFLSLPAVGTIKIPGLPDFVVPTSVAPLALAIGVLFTTLLSSKSDRTATELSSIYASLKEIDNQLAAVKLVPIQIEVTSQESGGDQYQCRLDALSVLPYQVLSDCNVAYQSATIRPPGTGSGSPSGVGGVGPIKGQLFTACGKRNEVTSLLQLYESLANATSARAEDSSATSRTDVNGPIRSLNEDIDYLVVVFVRGVARPQVPDTAAAIVQADGLFDEPPSTERSGVTRELHAIPLFKIRNHIQRKEVTIFPDELKALSDICRGEQQGVAL